MYVQGAVDVFDLIPIGIQSLRALYGCAGLIF